MIDSNTYPKILFLYLTKLYVKNILIVLFIFLFLIYLIDFIELAINKQPEQYRLYNCGYGIATSVRDLASKIISISGKSLKIKNDLTKPSIKTNLALNCDFANKEIGWYPKTTLNLGIEKTISWCRSVMKLR